MLKHNHIIRLCALLFTGAVSTTALAMDNVHAIASVGGGVLLSANGSSSQYFPIMNPTTDEYYSYAGDNSTQTKGLFDVFLGGEWGFAPNWALQLGAGYHQTGHFRVDSTFIQGADAQSADQYNYDYRFSTRQVMAESKLLYHVKERYHPYAFLGLGGAFNHADEFTTNVPPFLTFTREYYDNTQTSFTYSLGLGVDVDINKYLRIGVGYRFADLGQAQLGTPTIDGIPVSGALTQRHVLANEFLLQLSVIPFRN